VEEVYLGGAEDAVTYCLPKIFWKDCQRKNCHQDKCRSLSINIGKIIT